MNIAWGDQYLIGHEIIDAQHRHLFHLAGAFLAAVDQGYGPEHEGLTLAQLITYIETHFAAEEALMMTTHYPYLAAHQRIHFALASHTRALQEDHRSGQADCSRRLADFMREWLAIHIDEDDRQLIRWVNAAQAQKQTSR